MKKNNNILVVASNNPNKAHEIQALLDGLSVDVALSRDYFGRVIDIEEDGTTFLENAIKKVNGLPMPKENHTIYLADDSGLEIDALNGAPGIYSARYAGPNATYHELCHKILSEMQGKKNRAAQFRCVIAIRLPDHSIKSVEGIVKGNIIFEMRGDKGFGYDPIFQPDGFDSTFAEMMPAQKNTISHRAIAMQKAKEALSFTSGLKPVK